MYPHLAVTDPNSSSTMTNLLISASLGGPGNKVEKADDHQVTAFSHSCFIMSWMSELLASYNECKFSFMSSYYSKGKAEAKPSATPSFDPVNLKCKDETLSFMLCDLIFTGPLSQPNTP